ncbi:MAG: 4Fe-4S dicluster domain-containing protein [Candidatus Omnitrophota bacterium]|nr:MAG: 4Fe-4S dicluster domain-containing protein [Candidatus Omnitrophota bacterium]
MSELKFTEDKHVVQQTQKSPRVEIKKDKCKGCRLCILYCPTKHLKLSPQFNKKGRQFVEPRETTGCVGCGFCFSMCPDACIEIYTKDEG